MSRRGDARDPGAGPESEGQKSGAAARIAESTRGPG